MHVAASGPGTRHAGGRRRSPIGLFTASPGG